MEKLDANIKKISDKKLRRIIDGLDIGEKPMLIFTCGKNRNCFENDEQIKLAVIMDNIVEIKMINCDKSNCDILSSTTDAIFLRQLGGQVGLSEPIFFENPKSFDSFVQQILKLLPGLSDLSGDDFEAVKKQVEIEKTDGWLLCFYMGHMTELDLQWKRLPSIIQNVKIGKINCGRYSQLCKNLSINKYPMWGVLKPGGAFEINHGKNGVNDVAMFAENSIKARNVWALSAEKILSILQRKEGSGAWFLDWYASWCPPCLQFLPEVRKASLKFDQSLVSFGTVDCTIHSTICRQYNIRSYPTAMLINGTATLRFTMKNTAESIVQFIEESINPTVIPLNANNFYKTLGIKQDDVIWVVDYFVPWCSPCQQLAPTWMAVARTLHTLSNVKIASVDCEAENDLCRKQGVKSYPTIKLYPLDSFGLNHVATYSGSRDSLSLMTWIVSFLPVRVEELNEELIQKVQNSKKHYWIVDYYAPWCGYCQLLEPHFAIVAQLLHKKVHFGRFNCDKYRSECANFDIGAYPTLLLHSPRDKHENKNAKNFIKISVGTSTEQLKDEILQNMEFFSIKYKHDEL